MIDTTTSRSRRRGSRRGTRPARRGTTLSRSSQSILAALVGVAGLLLALIWVMNLEATLPSIRVAYSSSASADSNATLEPGVYPAENAAIELSGSWFKQTLGTTTSTSPTSSMVTSTPGSTMTFRFYGTDLSVTARIGPESGKVYVTVDGQESPTLPSDGKGSFVDLYANQAEDESIQIATGLSHRDHVVQLKSDGTNQVAISAFNISAATPFPWAFVVLYVSLAAVMFILVRRSAIEICKRLGWL